MPKRDCLHATMYFKIKCFYFKQVDCVRKCVNKENRVVKWENFMSVFANKERKEETVKKKVHDYLCSLSI